MKLCNIKTHTWSTKKCSNRQKVVAKETRHLSIHLHSLSIWRHASCIFIPKRSIKLSSVTWKSKLPVTQDVLRWSFNNKITEYLCVKETNKECNVMYHNIHDSHQACRKVYLKPQSWIHSLVLNKIVNDFYCLVFFIFLPYLFFLFFSFRGSFYYH